VRLIVIGGVAGGATAATRARRLSEDADIVLFERGFYVSYANCGLPYYIGGEIEKRDDLFIASPERLRSRYRIDVRTSQEVVRIDPKQKEVKIKDHATGKEFKEFYDKLILSPGSRPTKPPLPGINSDKIFTLSDLPDSDSIKDYLDGNTVSLRGYIAYRILVQRSFRARILSGGLETFSPVREDEEERQGN